MSNGTLFSTHKKCSTPLDARSTTPRMSNLSMQLLTSDAMNDGIELKLSDIETISLLRDLINNEKYEYFSNVCSCNWLLYHTIVYLISSINGPISILPKDIIDELVMKLLANTANTNCSSSNVKGNGYLFYGYEPDDGCIMDDLPALNQTIDVGTVGIDEFVLINTNNSLEVLRFRINGELIDKHALILLSGGYAKEIKSSANVGNLVKTPDVHTITRGEAADPDIRPLRGVGSGVHIAARESSACSYGSSTGQSQSTSLVDGDTCELVFSMDSASDGTTLLQDTLDGVCESEPNTISNDRPSSIDERTTHIGPLCAASLSSSTKALAHSDDGFYTLSPTSDFMIRHANDGKLHSLFPPRSVECSNCSDSSAVYNNVEGDHRSPPYRGSCRHAELGMNSIACPDPSNSNSNRSSNISEDAMQQQYLEYIERTSQWSASKSTRNSDAMDRDSIRRISTHSSTTSTHSNTLSKLGLPRQTPRHDANCTYSGFEFCVPNGHRSGGMETWHKLYILPPTSMPHHDEVQIIANEKKSSGGIAMHGGDDGAVKENRKNNVSPLHSGIGSNNTSPTNAKLVVDTQHSKHKSTLLNEASLYFKSLFGQTSLSSPKSSKKTKESIASKKEDQEEKDVNSSFDSNVRVDGDRKPPMLLSSPNSPSCMSVASECSYDSGFGLGNDDLELLSSFSGSGSHSSEQLNIHEEDLISSVDSSIVGNGTWHGVESPADTPLGSYY